MCAVGSRDVMKVYEEIFLEEKERVFIACRGATWGLRDKRDRLTGHR
jgi:hypothetical protein